MIQPKKKKKVKEKVRQFSASEHYVSVLPARQSGELLEKGEKGRKYNYRQRRHQNRAEQQQPVYTHKRAF